jgi:diguanylate cyclase (GGDEF)-like protein
MGVTKTAPAGASVQGSLQLQQPWRKAVTAIGVAALYILAAYLGLKLAVVHGNVTAIWPPSGIALAALLLLGPRFWPAVMAGAFIVNFSTGIPLATCLGIATGNTLAALAGLQLVQRFIGTGGPLDSVRSLLILLGGGAMLATVVSATVGVAVLALSGLAPASELLSIWLTWWFGDAAGVIIFAPLFLAWVAPGTLGAHNPACRRPFQTAEALILAASLVFTAQLVFGGWFVTGSENYPLAFLPLPVLIWAGFRFGRRGATAAVATMSLLAIWGTVSGYGPFVHADLNKSLLLLQVFMCVNAFTTLVLVAVLKERDAIRDGLQLARNELEQRVEERTRALLEANRFLLNEVRERRALQEQLNSDARCAQVPASRNGAEIRYVYERINHSIKDDFLKASPDAGSIAERLEAAIQYARITHRKVALLHVTIVGAGGEAVAHCKAAGTGLLQQVAERLQSVLRDTDTLARQGEDGFAILLEGVSELDDIASVAERIINEICIPFIAGQEKIYLAASAGISIFPDDAVDPPNLCRHADAAMCLAREGGGRKYHFHIEERASIDAEVSRLIGNS